MNRPLEGITVVGMEQVIAGPFCTRQLANLGARVIKIERPGVGDFARGYDTRTRGLASHFVWTNRSKESLTLDVKHEEAQKILMRLILEEADVVVQNLAPGAAARLGLGLCQLPDNIVQDELASGALVEVLPACRPPAMPISAVVPSGRLVPPRVRVLLDALDGLRDRAR